MTIDALDAALLELFAADQALHDVEYSTRDFEFKRAEAISRGEPAGFSEVAAQYLMARRSEAVARKDAAMTAVRVLHFQLRQSQSFGFGKPTASDGSKP